jgi:hypothetical protein
MNKLNYKLGILYRDDNKYYMTRLENEMLNELRNNELTTYERIYNVLYKTDVKKLKMKYRRVVQVRASRIRKKTGLKITSKNDVGLRLEDKLCVY